MQKEDYAFPLALAYLPLDKLEEKLCVFDIVFNGSVPRE